MNANKRKIANVLIGIFLGVSIGMYMIETDVKAVCRTIGLASLFLYFGLIYWHGGKVTVGAVLSSPLFMLSNVVTASLLLTQVTSDQMITLGAFGFVLSLVPFWMMKRAIRAGKIADGIITDIRISKSI